MSSEQPQASAGHPAILVYDSKPDGHRENCVSLFAGLTGGTGCIAPVGAARQRLITAPFLLLTTFETQPIAFLAIMLLRALLRRRTAVIFMRAHLRREQALRRGFHNLMIRLINRLDSILPLTLVRLPPGAGGDRFIKIVDPEFWDLDQADIDAGGTPLSETVRGFAGDRQILLVTGYIERARGIEFLRQIYAREDGLVESLVPVLCGMVAPDAREAAAALRTIGAFSADRFLAREEMMSLYRIADSAWCCYVPERNISSGIFGRAIQFGVAPIICRGSVLHMFSADIDNAVPLAFGDAEAASARLKSGFARSPPRIDNSQAERRKMRALLFEHFGLGPRGAR